jgi:regulatory protein
VYLDGEFAFVLYRGELRSLKITEGAELSEADYRKVREEILPKRATVRAMNLLQKKLFAEEELRRKLRDGEYPEDAVDAALEYVISYGYVDDVRYSVDYIRYHGQDRSRKRMEMDLARKGIRRDDFEKAWAECEDLGLASDEDGQIRTLLAKKKYDPEDCSREEASKLANYLLRKGYSYESIRRNMRMFADD